MSRSAAVSACEKSKLLEEALGLLQEMMHQLLTPDVVSRSAGITTCGNGKRWEGAPGVLQKMVHQQLMLNLQMMVFQGIAPHTPPSGNGGGGSDDDGGPSRAVVPDVVLLGLRLPPLG